MVRIYVYRYNTNTYTQTINIYKYNHMNPSIRLPDYNNLTSSIRLQSDEYRIKTTTNYNQRHIHTHIHIQLHIHNHIFITFLQWIYAIPSRFYNQILTSTNQQKRPYPNDDPPIQNVIQTNAKIPTPNQLPTDSKRTAILIYIWGRNFSRI